MTSFSPQVEFLSTPAGLVEVERYCKRCKECWPVTSEFWNKDARDPEGFKTICKACLKERRAQVECTLEPEVYSKTCTSCCQVKPVNAAYFPAMAISTDGFGPQCLACELSIYEQQEAQKLARSQLPTVHAKACSTCFEFKLINTEFFMPVGDSRDGFSGHCRDCNKRVKRNRAAAIKAGVPRLATFVPTPDTTYKACKACGIEKPEDPIFWHRSPVTTSGLLNQCKTCTNAARKLRRAFPGVPMPLPKKAPSNEPGAPLRVSHDAEERVCNRCEVKKPLTTEFWHRTHHHSVETDLRSRCKACDLSVKREIYRKLRDSNISRRSVA